MQEYLKKFSIDNVQMSREQSEDPDFAIVELWAFSEGNNTHRNPITREVLEEYSDTFKGKFIVAKYDKFTKDATTHLPEEVIVGYVSPIDNVEFKTKEVDGEEREFVVVKGVLSKVYAEEVVDMFRTHNERSVSCEFRCSTLYEENEYGEPIDEFGMKLECDNPILAYHIFGITILGLSVAPSIKSTEIKVKKFMEKSKPTMKQLAEQRKDKLKLVSHPIDKSKEVVDMGDWNGDKAKDELLKEKNFATLAKSVCLLLEEGWENRKKGALKYPVMNLKNGKWVYNAEGLSSARAYGEQHDSSVAEKAISIQKRLGLYKDDKEDTMEDKKKLSEAESKETEKDIVMEEQPTVEEKEMAQPQDNKEKQPKEEETKEMGCDETKAMADEESKEEVKEEKPQEEEKKFSLDAYVDQVAMLAMLEKETEQNKELAEKVMKQMSANEIVEKFVQMSKENAELKAEKEANDTEKRDKKFSAIMASVKEDLDVKKFSELSEEGKNLSLGELSAFENKVKAFAYEATKNKPKQDDDGIMRFAGVSESLNNQGTEDVFDRISKM